MGEVWVGWKSDDKEANIRTFPPSPPTHDIAVRFAWLLCPDWVAEIWELVQVCHASHPSSSSPLPLPPLSLFSSSSPPPPPPPPPPSLSPFLPSPIFSPLFHLPQTTRTPCSLAEYLIPGSQEEENQWESKFDLSRFYWQFKDNHSDPCSQVSV